MKQTLLVAIALAAGCTFNPGYGGLSEPTIAASQTLLVFDVDSGEIKDGRRPATTIWPAAAAISAPAT